MSEHNKAAARAEFEVWSSGELDRLDERVEAWRSVDTLGLLRGIGALPT